MALRSAADPRLLAPSAEQPAKPYGLFSNSRRTSKSRQLRSRSTLTSLASSNSRSTALSERLGSALGWRWLGRGSCFFHRYQPLDDDANLLKTSDFEDDDEEEAEIDGCVESRCDVDAVQHCWEGLERAWQERKHDDIEKPVFYDIVNMMCDSLGIRKPEHRDMAAERYTRLAAKFADRDVVGPAIPWSFLAIVQWFLLIPFASAAYRLTPPVEGPNCFSSYPPWLYCFVFMAYLGHFYVQVRILRYVNVAHVQQLEPQMPFEFFGVRTSYSMWLLVVFCIGFLDVMDIASHSLLYGKFVKSYDTNPDIAELWSQTISQSGMHAVLSANMARFFFIGWLFILLQPIIMLMHACPTTRDPSQMDYGLPNPMPDGYLTLMSYVMRFDISPPSTKDCKGDNNQRYGCCEKRRYWHADILRVMSEYGRLTAVTWNDRRLMVKRLERAGTDPQQGKLRFLQIYVTRLNEYCFRVLFMDIFEKAFKLEMQVSIVAFAHALRPPRAAETYKGARNCLDFLSLGEETLAYWILEYDWQMLVPALLAFVSLVRACILHVRTLWQLTALYMRHIVNKPDNGDQHNKTLLRTETDYDKYLGHSRSVATGCMACYVFLILVLACFCLHCSYKVVMMFVCPDSVANMVGGCVEIDFDRPWKNYEVRQDL